MIGLFFQLMNMGHGAAGNEIIHNHTIFATKKLLDSGINPKDILPIVSWGEVNRKDFVINKQDTVEYDFITTSALPGINLSDRSPDSLFSSITSVPVMSDGMRSGVNWILENSRLSVFARVETSRVFASPGTPINNP